MGEGCRHPTEGVSGVGGGVVVKILLRPSVSVAVNDQSVTLNIGLLYCLPNE